MLLHFSSTRLPLLLWLLLSAYTAPIVVQAQLQCTLSATDETTCLSQTDDASSDHCVWCALASFGFCVSETQAETMEHNIPGVHCDRYSATDDDAVSNDDTVPPPTDDTIPDTFWECLQDKTAATCRASNCTWCTTKAGFGLCMTGPTADSATSSDWFDCQTTTKPEEALNRYDGHVHHHHESSSSSSSSSDESSSSSSSSDSIHDSKTNAAEYIDTSCLIAFLQDQSPESCQTAVDATNQACQWCHLNAAGHTIQVCVTAEQAVQGKAWGMTCADAAVEEEQDFEWLYPQEQVVWDADDELVSAAFDLEQEVDFDVWQVLYEEEYQVVLDQDDEFFSADVEEEEEEVDLFAYNNNNNNNNNNPYDPMCALAFLQDQSKEACLAAQDEDGNACEYCTLQGAVDLCLTVEQAEIAEQIGVTCDQQQQQQQQQELADPYDTSCVVAFLEDQTEEGCKAVVDQDGRACEWCDLQGMANLCLNADQADMAAALGVTCDATTLGGGDMLLRGSVGLK